MDKIYGGRVKQPGGTASAGQMLLDYGKADQTHLQLVGAVVSDPRREGKNGKNATRKEPSSLESLFNEDD